MISLPDVTLVVIDCAAHELTKAALRDTLAQIDPGDVLVFSNTSQIAGDYIHCEHSSVAAAFETLWYEVPGYLKTSHMLHIEWDGWVRDGSLWQERWLRCDYIGALWPYDYLTVGNGGFSLRSAELMSHLFFKRDRYPIKSPEDYTLCREYRRRLEDEGFNWASEAAARKFSVEYGDVHPTFGFHDCRNFDRVLNRDELQERLSLANEYVRAKPAWQQLVAQTR